MNISQNQPVTLWVALGGVLSTGVALAAVLWPQRLDPGTQAAIIAFGNAVILAAATIIATSKVTPTGNANLPVGTSVNSGSAVVASVNPPPEPTANPVDTGP